jgi:serine/threonine-protein kinase
VQVSGNEQQVLTAPITASPEAYNLYVEARFHENEYSLRARRESLQKGQRLLTQAVAKDPNFAEALALLSRLYVLEAANFADDAERNLKLAEQAARRGAALKPDSAETRVGLGWVLTERGRNVEALRELREAVRLAPNSENAWAVQGYVCHYAGLLDCAERSYRRSLELNPSSRRTYWMHARMLNYQGRPQEAEKEMRRVLAESPDHYKIHAYLAKFLYYQGKQEEAESAAARALQLEGAGTDDSPLEIAAFIYAARGQREKIDSRVFQFRPPQVIDGDLAYWLGGTYALLGERGQALVWLRRAVELGNHNYPWFQRDKNYDTLRADPEYQRIMSDVRSRWDEYRQLFGS